ncbi:SCO4225 family membrane protein [Streptomyces flavochromogenes]|uniref:SCO4225 family membrane protein n=1 Tax=Streptomyces flavochromogenes TaxID=68199 RepID=A0ABW6XSL6_9ACTN
MRDSRPRTLVRLAFANPASLVYLGLVVAAALPMLFASATADSSFAAVWILLITAPTSMVLLLPDFADGDSGLAIGYFLAVLAFSALLHSFLLGLAYRGLRGIPAQQARITT